jgi:holo-[acyl-carrier protein] synthase
MEIVGIGTDIVECLRVGRMIEEHGELFLNRVYTDREIRYCQARKRATEHFAARWAAKEAVLKALATGWKRGMCWTDIEIVTESPVKVQVFLAGALADLAERLGVREVRLSLAHCRAYAIAYATALGKAG